MSWSVSLMGKPEKVVEALKTYADTSGLSGQSREEYLEAMPALVALVEQNVAAGAPQNPEYPKMVKVEAGGHGSKKDGQWVDRSCTATVSYTHTKILV